MKNQQYHGQVSPQIAVSVWDLALRTSLEMGLLLVLWQGAKREMKGCQGPAGACTTGYPDTAATTRPKRHAR